MVAEKFWLQTVQRENHIISETPPARPSPRRAARPLTHPAHPTYPPPLCAGSMRHDIRNHALGTGGRASQLVMGDVRCFAGAVHHFNQNHVFVDFGWFWWLCFGTSLFLMDPLQTEPV